VTLLRLFVAIPLAPEIRAALTGVQDRLREEVEARWVAPANLHLTVAFLGDQDEARVPELTALWAGLAGESTAFRIGVRGASAFPKRGPVKTLWVGLNEGAEEWKSLVRGAEPLLVPFGVPREGGLVPHITLGRVNRASQPDSLRKAVDALRDADCGAQDANEIHLIRSVLDPRGATYETVQAWPLKSLIENNSETTLRSS
jgi:2'-5' RNA ligase